MSPYRIGGGMVALVLAVLLLVVSLQWLGYTDLVRPVVSVSPQAQSSSSSGGTVGQSTASEASAMDVLAERTRLQADEANRQPSGGNESFVFQRGVANSESIARGWQQ